MIKSMYIWLVNFMSLCHHLLTEIQCLDTDTKGNLPAKKPAAAVQSFHLGTQPNLKQLHINKPD